MSEFRAAAIEWMSLNANHELHYVGDSIIYLGVPMVVSCTDSHGRVATLTLDSYYRQPVEG